jgi:hypothetical protein
LVIRLYVDENVDRRLIALLRVAGFDVVFSRNVHPSGTSDHLHLLNSARDSRILITHDKEDFRLLHFAWKDWFDAFAVEPRPQHSGIVRLPQYPELPTSLAVQVLEALFALSTPDDFIGRLLEWSRGDSWEEVLPGGRVPFLRRVDGEVSP